jgi:hypothetical protein
MNWYQKLSPSSQLVVSALISLLGTAIVTTCAAVYQNYTQAGRLDVGSLINYAIVTFSVLISKALYDYVPAHAVQLIQAGQDAQVAMQDSLQRAQAIASGVIATNGKQVQSASSQGQMPAVIVQPPTNLKLDDIQAISAQLAINLMHMAGNSVQDVAPVQAPPAAQPFSPSVTSVIPARPVAPPVAPVDPNAYIDPLKGFSAVLPAYNPNVSDMTTQSVPVA